LPLRPAAPKAGGIPTATGPGPESCSSSKGHLDAARSLTLEPAGEDGQAGRRASAALLLGALALGALPPGPAHAAPPVPAVNAQAVGNGVYIGASSTVPVAWEIQLSETRAPTGSPPSFGSILVSKAGSNGARQTSFAHVFSRRTPGITQWYIVKATDASGQSSYRTGEVKSNNRGVTLTYSRVRVLEDADDGLRGDGEIYFNFHINGCWNGDWASGRRSLGNGDSYSPNRTVSFPRYHAATIDLAVSGFESDQDPWDFAPGFLSYPPCVPPVPTTQPALPVQPSSGSDDSGNRATAASRLNLFQHFDHVQPTASETWTFETPAGARLKFRVEVALTFSYYA
jgi:hypothetical protein